jgi:hypothetical protein
MGTDLVEQATLMDLHLTLETRASLTLNVDPAACVPSLSPSLSLTHANLQFCTTRETLHLPIPAPLKLSEHLVSAILTSCQVRDDSRFLARLAFGIPSPRIYSLGFSRSALFGSIGTVDFGLLLARFEAECVKAGGKNGTVGTMPVARGSYGKDVKDISSKDSKAAVAPSAAVKKTRGGFSGRGGRGGSSRGRGSGQIYQPWKDPFL